MKETDAERYGLKCGDSAARRPDAGRCLPGPWALRVLPPGQRGREKPPPEGPQRWACCALCAAGFARVAAEVACCDLCAAGFARVAVILETEPFLFWKIIKPHGEQTDRQPKLRPSFCAWPPPGCSGVPGHLCPGHGGAASLSVPTPLGGTFVLRGLGAVS